MKDQTNEADPQVADDGGKRKEEGPRSFARFLAMISEGEAEQQLSSELFDLGRKLAVEVKAQGRKVSGDLKLHIKLIADTNGTVTVVYAIDAKPPKSLVTPALFWLTRGGNLSVQDTRQLELKPREVPSQRREPREVPPPAAEPPREV